MGRGAGRLNLIFFYRFRKDVKAWDLSPAYLTYLPSQLTGFPRNSNRGLTDLSPLHGAPANRPPLPPPSLQQGTEAFASLLHQLLCHLGSSHTESQCRFLRSASPPSRAPGPPPPPAARARSSKSPAALRRWAHRAAPRPGAGAGTLHVPRAERVKCQATRDPTLSLTCSSGRAGDGHRERRGSGRRGGRSGFPAPGRCSRSGPRGSSSPAPPPSEPSAAAMSSGASVNALQRLVEQLKLEAGVERIKVRRAAAPFPRGAVTAPPPPPGRREGRGRLPLAAAGSWLGGREDGGPVPASCPTSAGMRPVRGSLACWAGGDGRALRSVARAECPGIVSQSPVRTRTRGGGGVGAAERGARAQTTDAGAARPA